MALNLTPKARALFEKRLSITKAYDTARRQEEQRCHMSGERFDKRPFIDEFAAEHQVATATVYRWWDDYKEGGEDALIPGWGRNKGKTIIGIRFPHLMDPLIVPGRSDGEIIKEFLACCAAAGEKPPCRPTIRTYIKDKRAADGQPYAPPKPLSRKELSEMLSFSQKEVVNLRDKIKQLGGTMP